MDWIPTPARPPTRSPSRFQHRCDLLHEVENTGNVPFNLHKPERQRVGRAADQLLLSQDPGASVFVTETANIAVTTVNTATWTAGKRRRRKVILGGGD